MVYFVRFVLAFVVTLAIAVAVIYFVMPMFAKVKSPAVEKIALTAVYKAQNSGAEQRDTSLAMNSVAKTCLFFDARGDIMPVPPLTDKLKTQYAGMRHVKATSQLSNIKYDGSNATVTATNKVEWQTSRGRKMELRTTTQDKWDKATGKWECNEVKIDKTNNAPLGFVVPH